MVSQFAPHFPGLEARLTGYVAQVAQKLARPGVEIVNLSLVDTPEKALEAGHTFRRADVDLIFLHVTTYALSSTVLPVVRRAKVPVILLNLAPAAAIDYATFNQRDDRTAMTGEWLAFCSACPVPENANVVTYAGNATSERFNWSRSGCRRACNLRLGKGRTGQRARRFRGF